VHFCTLAASGAFCSVRAVGRAACFAAARSTRSGPQPSTGNVMPVKEARRPTVGKAHLVASAQWHSLVRDDGMRSAIRGANSRASIRRAARQQSRNSMRRGGACSMIPQPTAHSQAAMGWARSGASYCTSGQRNSPGRRRGFQASRLRRDQYLATTGPPQFNL
jgi:hypothetical protein